MRGDVLLLCSDGVWEAHGPEELAKFLAGEDLEEVIEEILLAAQRKMKGGCDNISAVAFRWEDAVTRSLPLQGNEVVQVDQERMWKDAHQWMGVNRAQQARDDRRADKPADRRGSIEDRYIGAFLDQNPYRIETTESRADRVATAIEVLRVAALSSYENRPISSGVLLVDADEDPAGGPRAPRGSGSLYAAGLTGSKSFYRLCDGVRTVFLVSRAGTVLDIVEIDRWASRAVGDATLHVPCSPDYRAHARATLGHRHVCVVLSPSHEIKVFAEGAQMFAFRGANWHLFDLEAKYAMWADAVGNPALAERLFLTALDLADAREGALFVLLRDQAAAVRELIAPGDRLDEMAIGDEASARRDLRYLLKDRTATSLDPSVLQALARIDGATVMDHDGRLIAIGAILMHPSVPDASGLAVEGARTTAAMTAGRFGPVLKVSEDGIITFFDGVRLWDV